MEQGNNSLATPGNWALLRQFNGDDGDDDDGDGEGDDDDDDVGGDDDDGDEQELEHGCNSL